MIELIEQCTNANKIKTKESDGITNEYYYKQVYSLVRSSKYI